MRGLYNIGELEFEALPEDLQIEIEEIAENRGLSIDELWLDFTNGEEKLPNTTVRKIKRSLKGC